MGRVGRSLGLDGGLAGRCVDFFFSPASLRLHGHDEVDVYAVD